MTDLALTVLALAVAFAGAGLAVWGTGLFVTALA